MFGWMNVWQDVLLILLALYFLLCIAYALDRFYTDGSMQEALFRFVVCAFLPAIGFVMIWMWDYYAGRREESDLSSVMKRDGFFEDDLSVLKPMNMKVERNRIPMEEALTLSDYDFRRSQIVGILNQPDIMPYIGVLRMAMENEDSETSHYASSIIMQQQEQMQTILQQKGSAWEQDQSDRSAGCEYEAELFRLLTGELMDEQSLQRYHAAYRELSDELLQAEEPEESLLQHRFEVAMSSGDLSTASCVVERYLTLYPKSEEAVYEKIMLCIRTKNREELETFYKTLSGRTVVLTQRVLEYIRFFLS